MPRNPLRNGHTLNPVRLHSAPYTGKGVRGQGSLPPAAQRAKETAGARPDQSQQSTMAARGHGECPRLGRSSQRASPHRSWTTVNALRTVGEQFADTVE